MSEQKPPDPVAEMPSGFSAETWALLSDEQKQAYLNPGQDKASKAAMAETHNEIKKMKRQFVLQTLFSFLMSSMRRFMSSLIGR